MQKGGKDIQKKENSPAPALRRAAEAYFAACDSTRERVVLKNGDITYHQVPYTMAGLCASLGISRAAIEKALGKLVDDGNCKKRMSKTDKELQQVYAWAAAKVEQHLVERALLGELNTGVASMLLKDWGYGEEKKKDGKEGVNELRITLEDPEALSR